MKRKIIYSLLAFCLLMSACKDYLDINTNPNKLTVTKPDFVLTGALVSSIAIKTVDVNGFAGYWCGYFAANGGYSQSGDVVRTYNLTTTYSNATWGDYYANLSNYNYVEQNVGKTGYENYTAICEIMKAYDFQNLVDIFGNIPYYQSLGGFAYLYPKYDNGDVIYKALANKLDSAVLLIKNNPNAIEVPAGTDILMQGNMTKWAQLANTLHLRLLIRQSEVGIFDAKAEVAKITANGYGFLTDDAATASGFYSAASLSGSAIANSAVSSLQSPLWETYGLSPQSVLGARDYTRPTIYAIDLLKSTSDARIDYLFRSVGLDPGKNSASPTYVGVKFGDLPNTDNNTAHTSGLGVGLVKSASQPGILFTAANSYFLQAEAVQKGWLTDDMQALYNNGIKASWKTLGVPGAPATMVAGSLKDIITQKWIANYALDALETWSDVRRLNIPDDILASIDPDRKSEFNPYKLLYPQTEYTNNPNNVNAQGPLDAYAKIFWDAN